MSNDTLQFTVNLRTTEFRTVYVPAALPHLVSCLRECSGIQTYANVKFCHRFRHALLTKDSQKIFRIQTLLCVSSSTILLQSGINTANHFQAATHLALNSRIKSLIQWLDDFHIHAKREEDLLVNIKSFFSLVSRSICKFMLGNRSSFFVQSSIAVQLSRNGTFFFWSTQYRRAAAHE